MRLMGLDLSTNTGWCVMEHNNLVNFGNVTRKVVESDPYPANYLDMAIKIGNHVLHLANQNKPELIIIEETNKGRNRYHQKQLEFIHFCVTKELLGNGYKIKYLDTSEWRRLLNLTLDKEDRKKNATINKERRAEEVSLRQNFQHIHGEKINLQTFGLKFRDKQRVLKQWKIAENQFVLEKMRSFRHKVDGKVVGKSNTKTLSVEYVNNFIGCTKFKRKDNDITDAICLVLAYQKSLVSSIKE